ncbi:MAG: YfhO family protein [Elusimicrobia bacterium]|nr:YfhO family protein [Elusimicrobiota bacterium]
MPTKEWRDAAARFADRTAPLWILAGLATALWLKALWGRSALFYDTLYFLFYPNAEFLRRCLRASAFPYWNPYIYGGVPFMANMQSAVFYPFTYLQAVLPFARAVAVSAWAHTALAGLFMYAFLRRLGASKTGALAAGIVFSLNGNFILRYAYPSQLHSYVWLPPMFLSLARARERPGWIAVGAAALALQVFAGHPQFALYSGAALALWIAASPDRVKGSALLLVMLSLAAVLAAVQLLPSAQFATESVRASKLGYEWATAYSIRPWEFLAMLLGPQWSLYFTPTSGDPHLVGFYVGPFALLLAALALRGPRERWAPFAAIAAAGALLSLGKHLPFYELMFRLIPPLGWFRFPAQALYLPCFALAVLAGLGADALAGRRGAWLAGLCAADLLVFGWRGLVWTDPAVYARDTPVRDLLREKAATDRIILTPRTRSTLKMPGKTPLEAWLKFKDVLHPNLALTYGFYAADGQEELRYARYDAVLARVSADPLSPWMDVLGIRYVLTLWDLPRSKFTPIGESTAKVFGNPQAFPKAYVAHDAVFVPEERAVADISGKDAGDLLTSIAVHDRALAGTLSDTAEDSRIRMVEYSPNRIIIETKTPAAGWLVVTDAWDAGWRAWVDTKRERVERVNYVQRAVRVPRGSSVVVFKYRPRWFNGALMVTAAGWLWAAALFIFL